MTFVSCSLWGEMPTKGSWLKSWLASWKDFGRIREYRSASEEPENISWTIRLNSKSSYRFSFHHSFTPDISITPLQLQRPRLQQRYCVRVNTTKCFRQLWVKDLPKVPTWRLEWDSNLRPYGRKTPYLPVSHYAPHHSLSCQLCHISIVMNTFPCTEA